MKGIYEQLFREPEKIKDWTDEAVPAGWADICRSAWRCWYRAAVYEEMRPLPLSCF